MYLLGTGLPSFWVVRMGEMRLTLGLSGWTTNDWTRGSALDLFAPPADSAAAVIERVADLVRTQGKATFAEIDVRCAHDSAEAAAALNHLAHAGQLISDLAERCFRWRQVMPMALGEAEMGPENEELRRSKAILARGRVKIESRRERPLAACSIAARPMESPSNCSSTRTAAFDAGNVPARITIRLGSAWGPAVTC